MFPLIKEKTINVYFGANRGPTFDNLRSFDGDIQKTSNYYEMNTQNLFDGSYYVTGSANPKSIANGHNNVADLEVYLVKGKILMVYLKKSRVNMNKYFFIKGFTKKKFYFKY